MHVQAFIPHRAIEALLFAILPGTAWVNVQCPDLPLRKPDLNRNSHKLWPIIAAQIGRRTVLRHKVFQTTDHALRRRKGLLGDTVFTADGRNGLLAFLGLFQDFDGRLGGMLIRFHFVLP